MGPHPLSQDWERGRKGAPQTSQAGPHPLAPSPKAGRGGERGAPVLGRPYAYGRIGIIGKSVNLGIIESIDYDRTV